VKLATSLLLLSVLFLTGGLVLDERRQAFGALPVLARTTWASFSPETSGLAIDRGRETLWIADSDPRTVWRVEFEEPVSLRGLSIDTGLDRDLGAKGFRVRLLGPGETKRRLVGSDVVHEAVFSCWHVYRLAEPFATRAVELRVEDFGREPNSRWALRDVRFLADPSGVGPSSSIALASAFREALVPFLLGVAWLLWLSWPRKG
jgi:hypothetical protein